MNKCEECVNYRSANYYSVYVIMAYYQKIVYVLRPCGAICKKCGFWVIAQKKYSEDTMSVLPHTSLNVKIATHTIPEIKRSTISEPWYCIEIGHFIFACINDIGCIVYFDVPIDIDAKCHMTNFQLEDGRVVLMCVNRNGDNIFIDEHGELVPYNAIPRVSPNTYETDKICIRFTEIGYTYTNKIAGAKTKAAICSDINST